MTNSEIQSNMKIHQDKLIEFLNSPEVLAELGWHSDRGVLLLGNTGLGKTYAMNHWLRFGTVAYKKIDAEDIELGIQMEGTKYIESIKWQRTLFWDDFGNEPKSQMFMGTSITPGVNILQNRYKVFIDGGFKTHMTSNLTEAEILEKYGERIWSRMKEMFNIIIVYGEDRRK